MATSRALLITSASAPASVQSRPTPTAHPGTVLLRPLIAPVLSYSRSIYPPTNTRGYQYPLPLVPGSGAVARIHAADPDAASSSAAAPPLPPGHLVLLSPYVRGRTDARAAPPARYLLGVSQGFTAASAALMAASCRDGAFAEVIRAPAECVFALDEPRLLGRPAEGGLGWDVAQLAGLFAGAVPFGGFRAGDLKAGEAVAVAPATGAFGGAAVALGLSIGARVIAMGRSEEGLGKVRALAAKMGKSALLRTVRMSGDAETDAAALKTAAGMGGLDVFFDISPPVAGEGGTPAYIKGGILALRHGGRCVLMGGIRGDLALPYDRIMHWDISVIGKWMYEPEDVRGLIQMAEAGALGFEWVDVVGRFPLAEWEEAWKVAEAEGGMGKVVAIEPQK